MFIYLSFTYLFKYVHFQELSVFYPFKIFYLTLKNCVYILICFVLTFTYPFKYIPECKHFLSFLNVYLNSKQPLGIMKERVYLFFTYLLFIYIHFLNTFYHF